MASIERTAYPRFKKVVSERELHEVFTPTLDEVAWARDATRSKGNTVALLVLLKSFQRLGYFPRLDDIPDGVIPHVGKGVTDDSGVTASIEMPRTLERYRVLVRERIGVIHDPVAVRVPVATSQDPTLELRIPSSVHFVHIAFETRYPDRLDWCDNATTGTNTSATFAPQLKRCFLSSCYGYPVGSW